MKKTKKQRAELVQRVLEETIPHPEIPLKHQSAFELLIAVLLSAQCTDERVNRTTPQLFALANTPQEMARLDPKEIEAIIRPCGLAPTKSHAIVRLSEKIVQEHEGKVPDSLKELEQLPGVGHKTASVLLVQAFQRPAFPVDTHIHRCAKRWKLSSGLNVKQTEKDLKALFPEKSWGKVHLQIVLFARKFCPARGHDKESCPICSQLC